VLFIVLLKYKILGGSNMERFSFVNKSINDRDLLLYYINRAGRGQVKNDFNIKRNNIYPYCVIHYVLKGSGHVITQDKNYTLEQGDLFLLNAYEDHQYFTDKDNLLELQWIEFAGGDAVKLLTAILKNGESIIKYPDSEKIRESLCEIFDVIKENAENNEFAISKMIYSMLLELLILNRTKNINNFPISSLDNISKAIYFIENNLGENLNLDLLSKICCYSNTYFAKLFCNIMGTPPMNYIMGKRINKAKELLSKSSDPVEQISRNLGFSSPSHFIRCFKKIEGLTPAEYRKQSLMFRD
jgi:AraC-like DNA-binding protein